MDHSHMDHGGMAHGAGMDMGGDRCNMNMLFTWDTTNLCIVFRQWHIRGPGSLVLSLLAIVAITAGYEALRAAARRYEDRSASSSSRQHGDGLLPKPNSSPTYHHDQQTQQQQQQHHQGENLVTETTPFLPTTGRNSNPGGSSSSHLLDDHPSHGHGQISQQARLVKSVLYGAQNFYAFMIMLLFMTYNGWVMLAVAVGAGVGYWFFGGAGTRSYKETACH